MTHLTSIVFLYFLSLQVALPHYARGYTQVSPRESSHRQRDSGHSGRLIKKKTSQDDTCTMEAKYSEVGLDIKEGCMGRETTHSTLL